MAIESIKTGKNAFVLKNGAPVFDWYRTHPEHKENFAKTMSSFGSIVNKVRYHDLHRRVDQFINAKPRRSLLTMISHDIERSLMSGEAKAVSCGLF